MRWLTIGLQGALQVREERLSTRSDACRLLYVSDIHLRGARSAGLCRQVMEAARGSGADAVLLGGDLVDHAAELETLCHLVKGLRTLAPVFAVGGNHDRRVGMERVRQAVEEGGGAWIHDSEGQIVDGRNRVISICGPEASDVSGGDVRVMCAHYPQIWKKTRNCGYDLVLAGHLHGCQWVAFEFRNLLFPGAFFYPYCYLRDHHGSSRLVVSRGVSDLVPIRWRCPREVVLCHV